MVPLTISLIEDRLRRGLVKGIAADGPVVKRAAVAVILRVREPVGADPPEVEVLLIRRAERSGDPWSGHAAFPGGRAHPADASIEATAIRETREEVGLDLTAPGVRFLGRFPDFTPMRRVHGLAVSPAVFEVTGDPPLKPDPREVAAAQWVPLSALRGDRHRGRFVYWWKPYGFLPIPLPLVLRCWRYGDLTIWGLTQRMIAALLEAVDLPDAPAGDAA